MFVRKVILSEFVSWLLADLPYEIFHSLHFLLHEFAMFYVFVIGKKQHNMHQNVVQSTIATRILL